MRLSDLPENPTVVVTGGAAGIGLAAAKAFAARGANICIVDLGADRLAAAAADIGGDVMVSETDVSDRTALEALEAAVAARFGGADVVINNAGIQPGSDTLDPTNWQRIMNVNLWGIIHGSQVFAPRMIERRRNGMIINTGSKQGITTPPGDPAYNVAKSGVKTFTEALEHEFRNTAPYLSAHLLIPGFVFTDLTKGERTEKPAGAWTPDQTAAFMMESLDKGDFYILCPDNDVPRALDEKRIHWAAHDIIENRPPLSRWHPDFGEAFAKFLDDET